MIVAINKKWFAISGEWVNNMNKSVKSMINYKGKLRGYKMYFTYKVGDNLRDAIYHKTTFNFDTLLTKATLVKDTTIDHEEVDW